MYFWAKQPQTNTEKNITFLFLACYGSWAFSLDAAARRHPGRQALHWAGLRRQGGGLQVGRDEVLTVLFLEKNVFGLNNVWDKYGFGVEK